MGWVGQAPRRPAPPTSPYPAHLVGDVVILVQEHLELADADAQVPVCELVGDVEAQGPKLTPLQGIPVEQTQRQQQALELHHLPEVGEGRRGMKSGDENGVALAGRSCAKRVSPCDRS